MIDVLLELLNDYAKEFANGNKAVLPAIGRIVAKLESETGKKVTVKNDSYILA